MFSEFRIPNHLRPISCTGMTYIYHAPGKLRLIYLNLSIFMFMTVITGLWFISSHKVDMWNLTKSLTLIENIFVTEWNEIPLLHISLEPSNVSFSSGLLPSPSLSGNRVILRKICVSSQVTTFLRSLEIKQDPQVHVGTGKV